MVLLAEVAKESAKKVENAKEKAEGNEYKQNEYNENESQNNCLEPDIEMTQDKSLEAISEENKSKGFNEKIEENNKNKTKEGIDDAKRNTIKEETGWSEEIIDDIGSLEEYNIYKKAKLQEIEINGKNVLMRSDIDWNQKDEKGRTNTERIQQGLAPLDINGNAIELHHIGQHTNSPLAELTFEEHRGGGNDTILHNKTKETEVHGEGNTWDKERQEHWKERAKFNEEGENS